MITAEKEQTVLEVFRQAMAKREHVVAGRSTADYHGT